MEYPIRVSRDVYKRTILKFMDLRFNLTKSEFNVLAELVELNPDVISTEVRLYLRNLLNKSEHNMNNYIMKLKDKNIILEIEEGLIINPNIIRMVNDEEVVVKFNIKESVNQD